MSRLAILFACGFLANQAFAADTPQITDAGKLAIGDFFKDATFRNATLSPDGKYILAVNNPDSDHQYVSLIDLASETSTDIIAQTVKGEYFSGLAWVSSDTAVFRDTINAAYSNLAAVNVTGVKDGQPKVKSTIWPGRYWIFSRLGNAGGWVEIADDEGSGSKECTCVYRADINAGPDNLTSSEQIYSLDPKAKYFVADRSGKPRVMETRDDDGVRHYFIYSTDTKSAGSWKEFKHLDDDKITFTPELIAPDGHNLYVLSNIGRNTIGYFEYDPDTDHFVRAIYANDEGDVTDLRFDSLTYSLTYATWYSGTEPHYEILDERARSFVPALQEAFPGQQVIPWEISSDGHEVLVFVYSDINSGAYYAFDAGKRNAELLGAVNPALDPKLMSPVRSGYLKTKDGFTLSYLISKPKSQHGSLPLVVIPHGGPIGIFTVNGFDPETQLLTSRGYAVLKVNYRGSGGSGKEFLNAGKHQWGRKIEDDIEEAVHAVLQAEPIDPDRVCIFGASYGGYSALMSVIRNPGLFKCAASYAGVTDLPLMYNTSYVQFDQKMRDEMADIVGDPTTDSTQLRAVSPVYLAEKISRPVFLAQGGRDPRVDEEQAYRLKLVMDALKKPLEFEYYPNEIHGFNKTDDEVDFYLRLVDFLNRNIGMQRSASPEGK